MSYKPNLKADELYTASWGLVYKIVCAPASWDADKVSQRATYNDPPGTTAGRWVISETGQLKDDNQFKQQGNPIVCADDPNRRHWLVNC